MRANAVFRNLVAECGIVLNDIEVPGQKAAAEHAVPVTAEGFEIAGASTPNLDATAASRQELLRYGYATNKIFLGEQYVRLGDGKTLAVCNTTKSIAKLQGAIGRFDERQEHTPRTVCAAISLAFWMADTLGMHIRQGFALQRFYSNMARHAAARGWDAVLPFVSDGAIALLRDLARTLTRNEPVALSSFALAPASPDVGDYDVVAFVDASATGWGAVVSSPLAAITEQLGGVAVLSQRWAQAVNDSATAEPIGVTRLLEEIRRMFGADLRVAVVTDHLSLVTAQRRGWSGHGGFGHAYALNHAYEVAYDGDFRAVQFWHIPGEFNPADAPSRTARTASISWSSVEPFVLPALGELFHPFVGCCRDPARSTFQC